MSQWTFLTNHAAVLTLVADRGQITAREIGYKLDLAERSVHRIITDLETDGYLEKHRDGRLNFYRVSKQKRLRREEMSHVKIGTLLGVLSADR